MIFYPTAEEMKRIDACSIDTCGIPQLVLMERAAVSIADALTERFSLAERKHIRILFVCEGGNNGGDGAAAARIMKCRGFDADIYHINSLKHCTDAFIRQMDMARSAEVKIYTPDDIAIETLLGRENYDAIVDSIFGVGLTRDVAGVHADIIDAINRDDAFKLAADIPSGISSDTGEIMGTAFRADSTVTFGFAKLGMLIGKGREYSGDIKICDIGFPDEAVRANKPRVYGLGRDDIRAVIPERSEGGNKGTFGRVLIIAGSMEITGAAVLSAKGAYSMGAGLVKVFTEKANRPVISRMLPEALISTYSLDQGADLPDDMRTGDKGFRAADKLRSDIEWATSVVIGPGLGVSDASRDIVKTAIRSVRCPVIIDADAINIISGSPEILIERADDPGNIIITPHMLEAERLLIGLYGYYEGKGIGPALNGDAFKIYEDIRKIILGGNDDPGEMRRMLMEYMKRFPSGVADLLSRAYNVTAVLKDARTFVASGEDIYVNVNGNSSMAKGGSGDVLSGFIGALAAQGVRTPAVLGVWLHGNAGDSAASVLGKYGVMARDLCKYVMKDI